VLSNGQEVRVIVVEIDRDRERIGLSLRQLQENPWDTIDQRYSLGQLITGPVTNVTPFGAFVQVEEAVEGLIHASELDVDPQTQPRDVLQPGQVVTAKVISLDRQRQRMGLSLRRVTEDQREEESSDEAAEGQAEGHGEQNGVEQSDEREAPAAAQPAEDIEAPAAPAPDSAADAPAAPAEAAPNDEDRPAAE
jgi:small subunit ribosomal protein S1